LESYKNKRLFFRYREEKAAGNSVVLGEFGRKRGK
jgi:hypothetical protein